MAVPIGAIVYVSFGKGRHVFEVMASLISAFNFQSVRDGLVKMVVVTDDAAPFARLPVQTFVIPPEQAATWRGPSGYVFNVKIRAMQFVLSELNIPALMIDGDTYFRRDPVKLFARVGPGKTLMHMYESKLGQVPQPTQIAMRDALEGHTYTTRRGDVLKLGSTMSIWNSGVVGCHPADVELVDEAFDFSGKIFEIGKPPIAEQMAFGLLFEKYTTLREARDVVFHYWYPPIRRPINEKLPQLLESLASLPIDQQAAALQKEFPRYSTKYLLKRWMRKRILVPLGKRQMEYPMS